MAGDFQWNSYRLARLSAAVRAYNAAITRAERKYEAQGEPEKIKYLPDRITTQEIKDRIYTAGDFRRIVGYKGDLKRGRSSELTRILRSYNPQALDITTGHRGEPTSVYAAREYKNNIAQIERTRRRRYKAFMTDLIPGDTMTVDLENLSPPAYAAAMSNTELIPPDLGEQDYSTETLDQETYQRWEQQDARDQRTTGSLPATFETYLKYWREDHEGLPYYLPMISALTFLRDVRPDILQKMFDTKADEIQIAYIIDSGTNWNPYWYIPFQTRHRNAYHFVAQYARYAGWQMPSNLQQDDEGYWVEVN